jgi:hypothetical protein
MAQAHALSYLRAISDDELIKAHDHLASNTSIGLGYYQEELVRRENTRQTERMSKMTEEMRDMTKGMLGATKLIAWLTVFIALLTVLNVSLVIITLRR